MTHNVIKKKKERYIYHQSRRTIRFGNEIRICKIFQSLIKYPMSARTIMPKDQKKETPITGKVR